MAQLTDLPNEIVAQIAQNVYPRDIVNFSTTSKFIHSVCEPALKVHHEMERKYKKRVCIGKVNSMADLLFDINLQPTAALYVECLAIKTCSSRWFEPPDLKGGPYYAYNQKTLSRLIQGIAETVPSDAVSTWKAALESGNEAPVLAMLLLRLPGIVTFKLKIGNLLTYEFHNFVHWLEALEVPVLSNLTTLYLHWECYSRDPEWKAISYFAILPSLRSMVIQHFSFEQVVGDNSTYLLRPRSSNVTSIIIENSDVEEEPLYRFLQGFKALQKFTCENNWIRPDPVWIPAALLAHCKASLEYLTLLIKWQNQYKGSLRDFENLKEVETYTSYFLDLWDSEHQDLAQVLPASIEKVHLHDGVRATPKNLQNMILHAAKDKHKYVPNLQELRVSLHTYGKDLDSEDVAAVVHMQAKCEENGFKLTID